ncbi:MAG: sulfatase [Planctomycetota bacterium]
MSKPSLLWIMTDQYNADCFSWAGHPVVRTPNLDRIAAEGVRFTQAYCQYPQCVPSRYSQLLGQYCRTHRMYGFVGNTGEQPAHLLEHFGAHGYTTGAFGKLHLDPMGRRFAPDRCAPSMGSDWFMARPEGRHYGAYLARHGIDYPTRECHGGKGYGPGPASEPSAPGCSDVPMEHNLERWTANEGIAFVREAVEAGRPFVAFVSFERPHKPVNIPAEQEDRIDAASIPLDPPETAAQLLCKPRICLEGRIDPCSDTWREPDSFRDLLKRYFTVIEMIDDEVGRILETLEALGVLEETAVVFCADHGDQAGRKRIFDKCQHASTNQVARIPFLLLPPKAWRTEAGGQTVDAPVESIDLYPTVCDWAGLPRPDHLEGRSLARVCTGEEAADPHRPAFCESFFRRAVVQDGWRLVHHCGGSVGELYHIAEDPLEYENLYLTPGHAKRVEQLKHELIRFLTGTVTEADTQQAEDILAAGGPLRAHTRHQRLHRSGCESGPFFVRGHAFHVLEYKHWVLFYRVDNRRHLLFDKRSDPELETDILPTPAGRFAFGELRDRLIDCLIDQHPPATFWEPEPLGGEMPTPEQVEAFLSQPLYRDA